ncbi:MAG TPA: vanadium-dependent haloperoxidase [Polyangiaceae bacterium]|jgi:hypothetical protein|nr:vanadium-dependent haloperoxidase [Polyangiaceae bacterium]
MKNKSARRLVGAGVLALIGQGLFACSSDEQSASEPAPTETKAKGTWGWVAESPAAALLSVHGTSPKDVWVSGADDGSGPVVLHYDGKAWERIPTGTRGDLWWVYAIKSGPVFFGGTEASLLRYEDGKFERIPTPGLGKDTIYGVWAASAKDVYAVGTSAGRNGFVWHYDGKSVRAVPLPETLPQDEFKDQPGLLKVWGSASDDVWVAGGRGVVLHGNAKDGFELARKGEDEILYAVSARDEQVAIVGGSSAGKLLEVQDGKLLDETPKKAPLLQGVSIAKDGTVWAVGYGGAMYRSKGSAFEAVDPGLDFAAAEGLHTVWVDDEDGVWAVGGDVLTPELDQGLALHFGPKVPLTEIQPPPPPIAAGCPEAQVDPAADGSIARRWDEQILGAIRRDLPRPTVHARNLFHLSLAMWDAFAAYDADAKGYLYTDKQDVTDAGKEREAAISYAAYRILSQRYSKAVGGDVSQACFDAFMKKLGYDASDTSTSGGSGKALGNRIARQVLDHFADDGANEANNYSDPDGYEPSNPYCVVDRPGTDLTDPLHWQQLVLAKAETQNGIPTGAGAQVYVGAQWGGVTPYALTRSKADKPYLDIGTPPLALDDDLVDAVVDVIRRSSLLDATDDTLIDISPASLGNNPLGTNDGHGYDQNPVTGKAYAPQMVRRSDFGRVLVEFWADGPTSETPPGHWNTIANGVADSPDFARKLYGEQELDPLSWDVHTYLALNGALHDAAIAAWELKRIYVSARPISLIRYMAGKGQRSEPDSPSYNPDGLPLIPGLIELITEDSSAPGERHEHLARYIGEIAIKSWRGEPGDRKHELGGVGFIRALEWMPYQRRTFVTPAFPGYVSGHSTFSRAAAEVLTGLTGSAAFPGGHGSYTFEPGYLFFESGPSAKVSLEWATYYDAADQAGQSRLWGGIHIRYDDFDGRRIGSRVGKQALETAATFYNLPTP